MLDLDGKNTRKPEKSKEILLDREQGFMKKWRRAGLVSRHSLNEPAREIKGDHRLEVRRLVWKAGLQVGPAND